MLKESLTSRPAITRKEKGSKLLTARGLSGTHELSGLLFLTSYNSIAISNKKLKKSSLMLSRHSVVERDRMKYYIDRCYGTWGVMDMSTTLITLIVFQMHTLVKTFPFYICAVYYFQ